jgi:hypothetical protein
VFAGAAPTARAHPPIVPPLHVVLTCGLLNTQTTRASAATAAPSSTRWACLTPSSVAWCWLRARSSCCPQGGTRR